MLRTLPQYSGLTETGDSIRSLSMRIADAAINNKSNGTTEVNRAIFKVFISLYAFKSLKSLGSTKTPGKHQIIKDICAVDWRIHFSDS